MKVKELIEYLEDENPDAEVLIMSQPSWPFEHSVAGVVGNEILLRDADADDPFDSDEHPKTFDGATLDKDRVFILEGRQLRYGNKDAWNNC